ncbi:MAG: glycerol-3-phosphate dehydrogenase [Burkholderiales bacterium]
METDLLIVGGGINGTGIARDAAGRGLRVVLVEQGDLGSGTSSASSKLIHGGLRYLEQLQFRLVAEALREREVMLRIAPHLVRPMRFVMPRAPHLRPDWMIRCGLFLYDRLAGRRTLPASGPLRLDAMPSRFGLKPQHTRAYAYSDCWVDDARLVIANARAAADLGARIMPRTACIKAQRKGHYWCARLRHAGGETDVNARAIINAAGAWADRFRSQSLGLKPEKLLKLVQGSHIVVPRLYAGDHAFIIQNDDRRVIFVYPYEDEYTLIGTTEVALEDEPIACRTSPAEIEYLCRAANGYLQRQVTASDVIWSYCGIRALVDDGAADPSRTSRDYLLRVDGEPGEGPLLSVLGGKITTYRKLAERSLDKMTPWFPQIGKPWTAGATLPGGDMMGGIEGYTQKLTQSHSMLPLELVRALVHRHGSLTPAVLGAAKCLDDLGEHFGGHLYASEVDYFMDAEWALDAEDVLWRRTKTGLHLSRDQQAKLRAYTARRAGAL